MNRPAQPQVIPLDVGSYTAAEAARLIHTPVRNIHRWMSGYEHGPRQSRRFSPPLWTSQLAMIDEQLEIGFRDLIELRFVKAFVGAGVGLLAVRNCLERAREMVQDERPFSTQRFRTDGRSIFLETFEGTDEPKLLDLKSRQYVFKQVFEKSFKDLELEDDTVARWRPFNGKRSIVIDPTRSFGQPVATKYGVPTVVLADAAKAEGSASRAARLFDVPISVVRDAIQFEESLLAA